MKEEKGLEKSRAIGRDEEAVSSLAILRAGELGLRSQDERADGGDWNKSVCKDCQGTGKLSAASSYTWK